MCSEAGSLLSGLLDCARIVLAPKLDGFLKHIEFVPERRQSFSDFNYWRWNY